jgi:hypothetical protein
MKRAFGLGILAPRFISNIEASLVPSLSHGFHQLHSKDATERHTDMDPLQSLPVKRVQSRNKFGLDSDSAFNYGGCQLERRESLLRLRDRTGSGTCVE